MAVTGPSEWDKVVDTLAASTLILHLILSVQAVASGSVAGSVYCLVVAIGCGLLLRSRITKRNNA